MKKSKQVLLICTALVFLVACVAAGTAVGVLIGRGVQEKTFYTVETDWSEQTLDLASRRAMTIFLGKVVSKGGSQCYLHLAFGQEPYHICYHGVQVEVIEVFKGEPEDTVLYRELGGETPAAVYDFVGLPVVSPGETYLFFLDSQGFFLSPDTLIPVEDGMITPAHDMLPDHLLPSEEAISLPLEEYLNALRACLS